MRIAVTGASGNVGSALLRRLVGEGHHAVGVVRRPPLGSGHPFDRVQWVSADLSDDSALTPLRTAFGGADAVVHLAWGFQPSHEQAYLEELGLGGTRRVVEAVRATGVPHLIHLSSLGAYAPKRDDDPVDETWPTNGIPTSWYSRTKAAAERLLDTYEKEDGAALVTRMRPGIIGQRTAGSSLLRYGVPGIVPARTLRWLPVLPLDSRLRVSMVHSDDVAAAIDLALQRQAAGPFNLAADDPVTAATMAEVMDARLLSVPSAALRGLASASWRVGVQPVDPGWLDMAFSIPLLDASRAKAVLGWRPTKEAREVFAETISGMLDGSSDDTPVLRPRSVPASLRTAMRRGPVAHRRRP
ncbi:NAD-dependent epimerase/dehydratase family protein [Nocardioides sp. Kera G14]|uniref:NAD-dependent epimerase/dehydratase family protein n=1 Tax=Nocardioides sp. Kera G14 TaxID=2884264 RepID=UPI001D109BAE|nr:NAD-dependent epimerase/dehydratase family protein [Nocardioides sp. Kera G14]UDY25008.1 NAD-dependent epimerase/dehydratase family protein [Nocardioides sp. Kera G14]